MWNVYPYLCVWVSFLSILNRHPLNEGRLLAVCHLLVVALCSHTVQFPTCAKGRETDLLRLKSAQHILALSGKTVGAWPKLQGNMGNHRHSRELYHHHLPQVNEEVIQLSNFLFPAATNQDDDNNNNNNDNNNDTPLSLHIHHGQLLQAEHALAIVQKQRDRLGAQGRALLRQLSEVYAIGVSLDIFIASEAFQVHLLGVERAFAALSE